MKHGFRFNVSQMRSLGRLKLSEISHNAFVVSDEGVKSIFRPRNAKVASGVLGVRLSLILRIDSGGNIPKIANPVVRSNAIYVVDLLIWPFAKMKQPCETMGEAIFSSNLDAYIAPRIDSSCYVASPLPSRNSFAPAELPCIRVIRKQVKNHLLNATTNGRATHEKTHQRGADAGRRQSESHLERPRSRNSQPRIADSNPCRNEEPDCARGGLESPDCNDSALADSKSSVEHSDGCFWHGCLHKTPWVWMVVFSNSSGGSVAHCAPSEPPPPAPKTSMTMRSLGGEKVYSPDAVNSFGPSLKTFASISGHRLALGLANQLGPDFGPIGWPEVGAVNLASALALNCNAQLRAEALTDADRFAEIAVRGLARDRERDTLCKTHGVQVCK